MGNSVKTEYHVSVVRRMGWPAAVLAVFWMVGFSATVYACDDWVAKVVAVEGLVQRENAQRNWQPLQAEQTLCPGESVRVGNNSRAALHLRNNTFTRLDANSVIHFPTQATETRFWIELKQGLAHFISRIVHQFEVATPYVNAVVEGTEFIVSASEQGAVSVVEGKVTAYNDKSRTQLTAGQQVAANARDGDLSRFNIPPTTVVEWAIYYPTILTLAELPASSTSDKALLQAAIIQLQNNRIDQALVTLDTDNPSDIIKLAQATLLLKIGRLPEFNRVLTPILQSEHSGLAYGLKTIADIAHHDNVAGRKAADTAVKKSPDLAASWIALSYAQQAELDLPAALASAHKATQVQPGSLLASIHLSELYLAQGDIDAARKTLEAVPDAVGQQAALENSKGFVQLFRLKIKAAKEHFHNALQMDSSNPQTHLGLGLALLRDGDLEQGRQELEYAVSLDPLRSVLRSYMGRAYFEEKRDKEAIKQWELAKQFDPNDPTPYFYTGVYKLFANDPVGAIDELETSRNLNDKRAIYRSETLLQSDAASRSAAMARAYNEVGYQQGVLLHGWDAVQRDPANSEGHRLLADYYAQDPRFESARVSELLQSQLLQPLTAYPLQPQLGESNIALVAGAGPQRPGINEYHSLFTQNGVYGMANAYGGADGTWGDDLVGSFLAGPLALSIGQYHFESDGWRNNADQEQDIYDVLAQWQMTPSTSIQYESRELEWDKGDLTPHYLDLVTDIGRNETKRKLDRIGLSHAFNPANTLIVSLVRQKTDDELDRNPEGINVQTADRDDWVAEIQAVSKAQAGRLVYGAGYSEIENHQNDAELETFVDPDDDTIYYVLDFSSDQRKEYRQHNAYLYYFGNLSNHLEVNLGVAFDRLDQTIDVAKNDYFSAFFVFDDSLLFSDPLDVRQDQVESQQDQWSPKIGFRYGVNEELFVRAAFFRTMARYKTAGATIEPTIFTGFVQQYMDDPLGADTKNYAIAFDHGSGRNVATGMSFVSRNVQFPAFRDYSDRFGKVGYNVELADAYLTYLWVNNISLKIDLTFVSRSVEKHYRTSNAISEIDQYALPLEVRKEFSSGLSSGLRQTYYHQELKENPSSTPENKAGWVTDLFLRYRIPNRIGSVEAGIKNLLDEDDEFVSYDGTLLAFYPKRYGYLLVNLNL